MSKNQVIHLPFFKTHINVYVIQTPRGYFLVDTGIPGMLPWVLYRLFLHGIVPEEFAGVILTHCHLDHIGGTYLLQRLGIPIYAHHLEVPFLQGTQPWPGYGGMGGAVFQKLEQLTKPFRFNLRGVHTLENHQILFGSPWQILGAPGHSPGSIALWNQDTGSLITGDTLTTSLGKPQGPHPMFTEDLPEAEESALALLDMAPKYIFPGHGPPIHANAFESVRYDLQKRRGICRDHVKSGFKTLIPKCYSR